MIHKISNALLLLVVFNVNPQASKAQSYVEKQSIVTLGYGFPNLYKSILKSTIENKNTTNVYSSGSSFSYDVKGYGPLFVKYEYALTSLVGIGASIGYWDTKFTENHNYQSSGYDPMGNYVTKEYNDKTIFHFSSLSVGARLNFHFGTKDKLDPYAGIAAGYTNNRYDVSYVSNNPDYYNQPQFSYSGIPVYFAFSAGLRYYFTKNIGAYAEVGIDKLSVIQGGLAIKF